MKKLSKILCLVLSSLTFIGCFGCGDSQNPTPPASYTITYELDGGVNNSLNPSAYTGADEITFSAPTKDGYDFIEWQSEGVKITGIPKGSSGNITVKAVWQMKTDERDIQLIGQTYKGTDVVYPDSLWTAPEYEYEPTLDFADNPEGVKGLFYNSVPYNGKPTKVAGYIGFPEGATATNKVPAIVLVHGAGGTAFPEWVKYWNELGFAAICMDLEGAEPIEGVCYGNPLHNARNRYENDSVYTAGPTNCSVSDGAKAIEEQFVYHATSAVIKATSLICSFDCVDIRKVGITGVSWGSIISSIVIGYDDRLTFGMPVYGGVSITESCSSFQNMYYQHYSEEDVALGNAMRARWDTLDALKQTECKTFFITSNNDFAFSMDIASRCAEASSGLSVYKFGFKHSNGYGAEEENLVNFARFSCGMDAEFVEIVKQPTMDDPTITVKRHGGAKISSVRVYYTMSEKTDGNADWNYVSVPAKQNTDIFNLPIPICSYAFVQIAYENGTRQVCSYIMQNKIVADDFTSTGVSGSKALEISNLISDTNGHADYGLVPGSVWGGYVSGGDGYLVYKISADENKDLSSVALNLTVGVGHQGGAYWYNGAFHNGTDVLGANVLVYVSVDNQNWTEVYNLDYAESQPITGVEEARNNILNPIIDLTPSISGTEMFIKIYVKHFTTEETAIPSWINNGGILLGDVGVSVYGIKLIASQTAK